MLHKDFLKTAFNKQLLHLSKQTAHYLQDVVDRTTQWMTERRLISKERGCGTIKSRAVIIEIKIVLISL